MTTRWIIIDVPEKILLAEKMDEIGFRRELRVATALKLYELGRLSPGKSKVTATQKAPHARCANHEE